MKIFTIDPSSATGDVSIEEGAKLDTFTIKNTPDKKFYGLYLGYFRNDLDKQPEDRTKKYFLIHNHINLTDKILYLNPCFKGEEKVFKQGNAIASDSTTDKCIMYLYNDNTRVRAKFDNAKELFINNKLISGCIKSEKTMLSKDGKVIQDEFFVTNDYRNDTNDSRKFGSISKDEIVGRVIFQVQIRDF